MRTTTTKRWLLLAAVAIVVGMSAPAAATLSMVHTYRTGIDVGNDPGSGCDFSVGTVAPGMLPGFELQITVVVDANVMPPQVVTAQVVTAQVETCDGAAFIDPQVLPDFQLEFDSGGPRNLALRQRPILGAYVKSPACPGYPRSS